jgi:hypothetical protein
MVGAVVESGTSDAVRFIDMETDARLPVTEAVGERPPFGAIERLSAEQLREEQLHDHPERLGFVRHRLVPQVLAFGYYQLSWVMYAINPHWSYRLNADFEDHAEHEYALLVSEHPEWEDTPYEGSFNDDYGDYASLADLFRQIGYDERLHKLESEGRMERARFD